MQLVPVSRVRLPEDSVPREICNLCFISPPPDCPVALKFQPCLILRFFTRRDLILDGVSGDRTLFTCDKRKSAINVLPQCSLSNAPTRTSIYSSPRTGPDTNVCVYTHAHVAFNNRHSGLACRLSGLCSARSRACNGKVN